jgi:hypothetical protein
MTRHRRKKFEALPSAGIYTRYTRGSSRSRQSAREQLQSLERVFRDVNTLSLHRQMAKFAGDLERFARQVLRRFEQRQGIGKLHPLWEKALKGNALARRQAQINARIAEIRNEAAEPNAVEVLKVRKRLAEAEGAADALELLNHARLIPTFLKNANLPEQNDHAVWWGIATAFEMGQAYERIKIRPIEAYARTAIIGVKKARERNRRRVADENKERLRAYARERSFRPDTSHWAICLCLAPRFKGNNGHPLTPRAFSNSIPRSMRIVSARRR